MTGSADVKNVIRVQKIRYYTIHEAKSYFTGKSILYADYNIYVLAADKEMQIYTFVQK